MKSVKERFLGKIKKNHKGCWIWEAGKDSCGYGTIKAWGKMRKAHRVAYQLYIGPISKHCEIDHTCFVRECVNPGHLQAIKHAENIRRSIANGAYEKNAHGATNRRKTHCPQGHRYSEKNTYVAPNGWRQCQTCRSKHMQNHLEKRRSEVNSAHASR